MHIPVKHLHGHETKREVLLRFLVVLAIFLAYFAYVAHRFGVGHGIWITLLTWSFFVLCTPIADAGFLLDFPIRVVTGIRMVKSEAIVWLIAIAINVFTLLTNPGLYEKTIILSVFYHILTNPVPYWLIILLSFAGTFLSIYFGDELLDVVYHHERAKYLLHRDKYKLIAFVIIFFLTLVIYKYFLDEFGIHLF
ncbi:MAG TPA: hypothetical protein EYH14_00960 [Euryarchaeota archaeon]|nr:hypothetical protein [Euryarchaeota archaeon]